MTRKQALVSVRAAVARDGRVTAQTLRIYVENRISYVAFSQAVHEGLGIYDLKKKLSSPVVRMGPGPEGRRDG